MSDPRTPGCDDSINEFAQSGGITNGAAWYVEFAKERCDIYYTITGTLWVEACRTSTISPPTTSRSLWNSAATSSPPAQGIKLVI